MSAVRIERDCEHAEKLCYNISFMYECKAPKDIPCEDRKPISDNLTLCRRYDNAISKILAKTQDFQR